jgi:hypothetical protein
MECLITSLGFELFENIIHMELDSTLTNNEAIGNIAIAMSLVLVRSRNLWVSNVRISTSYFDKHLYYHSSRLSRMLLLLAAIESGAIDNG